MKRSEFQRKENWEGSYYELSLELGPTGDDDLANRALQELWRQPELRGPWRQREPEEEASAVLSLGLTEGGLYGCLTLTDGTELGCRSHLIRVEGESDWLDLAIPTGMLDLRFPVSYPLAKPANPWLVGLELQMARIGAAVRRGAPFRLGLLGEETSGRMTAEEITAEDCEHGGFLVPEPLWRKLSPKREPIWLPEGLAYFPSIDSYISYRR